MRTLYIECNMGAAGDMLMAALYELLDEEKRQQFLQTMSQAGLPGVSLEACPGKTCGIAGTHMKVTVYGQEESVEANCAHSYGHDHEHSHDHGHSHDHSHGHDHSYGHDHDHGHVQDYGHAHDHGVVYSDDYNHSQDHAHTHSRGGNHAHSHFHGTPGHIREQLRQMDLPEQVRVEATAVYDRIARAEAKAHGCPVGEVHFHEVGALDAVADVTGVCYALYLLGAEQILVSPVHVGCGTVRCAHGIMPVPAPATANLLEDIPVYGGRVQGELCTPTGAALLRHFADGFGPMPVMKIRGCGIGIGTKQFDQANCVRIFLGETEEEEKAEITELVCNIDDMTPEALSFACSRLLELGALDVYTMPGTMKKGRSGHVLTVLCSVEEEQRIAHAVLEQTATNGLRVRRCGKYYLEPGRKEVLTPWGRVRIKTAEGQGIRHMKPEYEDVAELARKHNISYQQVFEEALRKTEEKQDCGGSPVSQ